MSARKTWSKDEVRAWFAGRVPDSWFVSQPQVQVDRDEILVTGELSPPTLEEGTSDDEREVAHLARIEGFREETRGQRMRIADEAERLWGRKVSWGAKVGDVEETFTTQAVPVMTRLRLEERGVLDT